MERCVLMDCRYCVVLYRIVSSQSEIVELAKLLSLVSVVPVGLRIMCIRTRDAFCDAEPLGATLEAAVDVMNVTQKKRRHSAPDGDMMGVMRVTLLLQRPALIQNTTPTQHLGIPTFRSQNRPIKIPRPISGWMSPF